MVFRVQRSCHYHPHDPKMVQKSIILLLIFIQQILYAFGIDSRIIGGDECDYELHPYAVAIFVNSSSYKNVYLCGGSLISLEWILSAAHCIPTKETIENREIILTTGFNNDNFFQKRQATKGIRHDKYGKRFRDIRYDIGLLLANKPFKHNAAMVLAKLPTQGFASTCKTATAIGIGETKKQGLWYEEWFQERTKIKPNKPLRCVELPIFSREICSRVYKDHIIDESIICTLDEKGEKDTCLGDDGNPILCEGVLIGVHIETGGCAHKYRPSVHTNIEYFLDFIAEHAHMGKAAKRQAAHDGSNTIVLSRVLSIIALLLHYIVFSGFN